MQNGRLPSEWADLLISATKPMCVKDRQVDTFNSFKSPRSKSWPFPAAAITVQGKLVVGNGSDWPNYEQWPRSRSSVSERCSLSLTTITPLPIRFPASSIPAGRALAIISLDNQSTAVYFTSQSMIKTSKVETIIWVWPQIVTAEVAGFHKWVWFDKATLTYIFAFHEMESHHQWFGKGESLPCVLQWQNWQPQESSQWIVVLQPWHLDSGTQLARCWNV